VPRGNYSFKFLLWKGEEKEKRQRKHCNKKAVKCGLDVDKDIDEREEAVPKHAKEKSKRKWF
jgi:hypothetical protein